MKTKSIWSDLKKEKNYPKLNKNITTDVLIIGGGITGVSIAYHLSKSNLNVCLVEKNRLGQAVTSKTTGKLTYLQENIYSKLNTFHNLDTAKLYLESQRDAINIVKNIIEKEKINSDFEKVKSYVYSDNQNYSLTNEKKILYKLNVPIKEIKNLPNDKNVLDGYFVEDTYVFHPLKYLYSLADICTTRKVNIFENTKIINIEKENDLHICHTPNNVIKAKYIVLALHYPYFLSPFWMPLKCYIEKSYIRANTVKENLKYSSISTSKPTVSTRYHSNNNKTYEIYLSNSHNLCIKNNEKDNFKTLNHADYLWSNQDIMTADFLPFIGKLKNDNTMFLATGYNTWGMTNGSLAGKIISDLILNIPNKYTELFNPNRKINLGKVINFPVILTSNAYSFLKSKISKQKAWYSPNVKFENRNGKEIAIYIDENKKEHIVYNICPHLKCSLIFNEIEKTWDCPCHGSRFDIDGNSIEGPSNYNITYKE